MKKSLEKDGFRERLKFISRVAALILTETLEKGGYTYDSSHIASQSESIAEQICLYCGANEGLDMFNDDDIVRSAVYIMSEGSVTLSDKEFNDLKEKIKLLV